MTGPGIVAGPPKPSSQSQRDSKPASGSEGFAAALTNLLQPERRPAPSPSQPDGGHATPQTTASSERAVHAVGHNAQRAAAGRGMNSEPATPPAGDAAATGDASTHGEPAPSAPATSSLTSSASTSTASATTGDATVEEAEPVDVTQVDVAALSIAAAEAMPVEAVPASAGTDGAPVPAEVEALRGAQPQAADLQEAAAAQAAPMVAAEDTAVTDAPAPGDDVPSQAAASGEVLTPPASAGATGAALDTPADAATDAAAQPGTAAPQAAPAQTPANGQPTPPERPLAANAARQQVSEAAGDAHRAGMRQESGELLSEAPIPDASPVDVQGVSPQTAVDADVTNQPHAPAQPTASAVDPVIVVDVDNPAVTATGQSLTATHNAGGGSPAPALAPATTRIIELVERLRAEPPPQQLVVDLDQFGIGRLVISLRADKVLVGALGTAGQPDPQWWQDLGDALDARGWSLEARDGQPQRDRHEPQPQPQSPPVIPTRPLRRRSRAGDGLRL